MNVVEGAAAVAFAAGLRNGELRDIVLLEQVNRFADGPVGRTVTSLGISRLRATNSRTRACIGSLSGKPFSRSHASLYSLERYPRSRIGQQHQDSLALIQPLRHL